MDKRRLRVLYVAPQTEYFACEPCRMVAASPGGGGHDPVTPNPGGEITDSKRLEPFLLESPSFGPSHSDVWESGN